MQRCVLLILLVLLTVETKTNDIQDTSENLTCEIDDLTTTNLPNEEEEEENNTEAEEVEEESFPKLREISFFSNISNRFASTLLFTKFENKENRSRPTAFEAILPKSAYITSFTMEINGKNYSASVKNIYEAENIYIEAMVAGKSTALLGTNERDANKFAISISMEPNSTIAFYLAYEELLKRHEHYSIVLNVNAMQRVEKIHAKVEIHESKALKFAKTIPINIENDTFTLGNITTLTRDEALANFELNVQKQEEMAFLLTKNKTGEFTTQFIVEYDVERDFDGGEILIKDGYFVHFFAPDDVTPLPKHVVFVLDTSGSMMFQKIDQLRIAMKSIVSELRPNDIFHLVEFNNDVLVWNISYPEDSVRFPEHKSDGFWFSENRQYYPIDNVTFPFANNVNQSTVNWTSAVLDKIDANGGTNIYEALRVSLTLINREVNNHDNYTFQPLIIFLTDGEPTIGVTNPNDIISQVKSINKHHVPIFSLSFGDGADRELLKNLSLSNFAFSKHIYEAADAALQLENFYKEISSPLLTNVTFKYVDEVRNLSKTMFPVYFGGGEFVVTGQVDDVYEFGKDPRVTGWGVQGPIDLRPHFQESAGELERLWAYLTIQQLIEETSPDTQQLYREKITELGLKYSFVTPYTSFVVYKPNKGESLINFFSTASQYSRDDDLFLAPTPSIQNTIDSSIMDFEEQEEDSLELDKIRPKHKTNENQFEKLTTSFPWIQNILNVDQSTINLSLGTFILNETIFELQFQDCIINSNNFSSKNNKCVYLSNCPKVQNYLISLDNYLQLFCSLHDKFAGVCCPQ